MYPEFIADAQVEGEKVSEKGFTWANEVEKTHQKEFVSALNEIEAGKDLVEKKYFVCHDQAAGQSNCETGRH